jgi:hypothetical protein
MRKGSVPEYFQTKVDTVGLEGYFLLESVENRFIRCLCTEKFLIGTTKIN